MQNELTDFENSVNLKNNFYLIVYGKDNKTLSNQLKFVELLIANGADLYLKDDINDNKNINYLEKN